MRASADLLQLALDSDLVASGWDGSDSYPGQSARQFSMMALSKSLLKKFQGEVEPDAEHKALAKFIDSNELCKSYVFPRGCTDVEAVLLGEFRESVWRFFSHPSFCRVRYEASFGLGPGASLGSPTTSFYSKVSNSELTYDKPELPFLFTEAIRSDPLWLATEERRSQVKGRRMVQGNVLSHVPKTRQITRTICTEPILNMLYQKGIGKVIEDRLVSFFGIRLDSQPDRNANFARIGSVTGQFATIDLESASDSISLNLLSAILPKEILTWLKIARSDRTVLPDGSSLELHMVSSMGNAFTFPLQTAIFACAVASVYRSKGVTVERCDSPSPSFGVFGDDIVVRRDCFDSLVRLLSLLGFRVNRSKSFSNGDFRESCGSDYFLGTNVRGVYIQHLETVQDVYSAINRLTVWSAKHEVLLSRAISYLQTLLPKRKQYVPFWESDTAGLKVPLRFYKPRRDANGSFVYYCDSPRGISFPVVDVEAQPPKLRGYFANADGIMMAALAGYCFGGTITVRPNGRLRYRPIRRVSPGWDPHVDPRDFPRFGERWKALTPLNLNLS